MGRWTYMLVTSLHDCRRRLGQRAPCIYASLSLEPPTICITFRFTLPAGRRYAGIDERAARGMSAIPPAGLHDAAALLRGHHSRYFPGRWLRHIMTYFILACH